VRRELGIGYSTLCYLLEGETDEEVFDSLSLQGGIFPGIDEHNFRHHELVHTITEVKRRRMLGILG
jgi:hypothetical protein